MNDDQWSCVFKTSLPCFHSFFSSYITSTLHRIAFFPKMFFVIIIMVETEHSCTINTIAGTNKHSSGLLVHAVKWSSNRPQRGGTILSFILYAVIKILSCPSTYAPFLCDCGRNPRWWSHRVAVRKEIHRGRLAGKSCCKSRVSFTH